LTRLIEVQDIGFELVEEMALAEDQQEVQALAPQATDEPLTHGVRARDSDRRVEDVDADACRNQVSLLTRLVAVVADQIARASSSLARRQSGTDLTESDVVSRSLQAARFAFRAVLVRGPHSITRLRRRKISDDIFGQYS
jgi:hypothetical protein